MATKGWSIGALANALTAFAFSDPADVYKAVYPVGSCILFDSGANPNTAFPGTTWVAIEHGKAARAATTLALVGTEGGAASGSLAEENMPAHTHDWSGGLVEADLGTDLLVGAGAHTHSVSLTLTSAGAHVHGGKYHNANPAYDGGTSASRTWETDLGYSTADSMLETTGAHVHTVDVQTGGISADHTHTIVLGSHAHTVTGSMTYSGVGAAINYNDANHMYGMWKRTA